ncbi:MAG: zinc transport system substrate-binding protein [Chlamydiales bacterium]|jgi:zinc transport system substrate-binding protein
MIHLLTYLNRFNSKFGLPFLAYFLLLQSCSSIEDSTDSSQARIVTSIAPYKYFIERIAGDSVTISVLVPNGESPHTFEPTPKQVILASQAKAWFQVGDPFEQKMSIPLKQSNPAMLIIDLRDGLSLIQDEHHHCHDHDCHNHNHDSHNHNHDSHDQTHETHHDGMDVHTWLSPKLAMKQARSIAKTLIQVLPEQKDNFTKGLEGLLEDLHKLDDDINGMLSEYQGRTLMFSHSAFTYFCLDYKLEQFAIECEGKEPHPSYITKTMENAKKSKIGSIFLQKECSEKGGKRIAEALDLKTIYIYPYAENYLENMRQISLEFRRELSQHAE